MFEYKGVCLRSIERQDIEILRQMRNDPDTWYYLGSPVLLTENDQLKWFESLYRSNNNQFFVYYNDVSDLIGLIRMDEIDDLNRSIRIGGDVLPEFRGRGFGTKMYELMFKYCFDYLNKYRVWLLVLDMNERARCLYEKMGMLVEGKQRQAVFRDGRYCDYIMMSILESEYRVKYNA